MKSTIHEHQNLNSINLSKNLVKKQIAKTLVLFICTMSLFSCKKIETTKRATAQSFSNIQDAALADLKQTATFNAETGIVFTSTKGVKLTIPANSLQLNGSPVTGPVNLEFTEIVDDGNMSATNKPTMGVLPDGKQSILISGGEFNINVLKNGQLLTPTVPMPLEVPTALTNDSPLVAMQLFEGAIDVNRNLKWVLKPQVPVQVVEKVDSITSQVTLNYATLVNEFGWTNIDKFHSDPRAKTTMLVSVPEGYNYGNCALYLHYDGQGSALARLDTYDAARKLFTEHYGQIPIGLECHLIFVTEENGQWKYAIKPLTISANTTYNIAESEITTSSKSDYVGHVTLLR